MIAGIAAGIAQVAVGHPFDTFKTRIQNGSFHTRKPYAGWKYPLLSSIIVNGALFPTYQAARKETRAFVAGALAGAVVTPFVFVSDCYKITRQVGKLGTITFKGFFPTLLREVTAFGIYFETYERMNIHPLVDGACAGATNWLVTYPIDVVRTRQIARGVGIWEAVQMGALYKGIGLCLARAVLVNAAVFGTYEFVRECEL